MMNRCIKTAGAIRFVDNSVGIAVFFAAMLACACLALAKEPNVPAGLDPGGVAVAIFGPGIDYTAPGIAKRLARDGEGNPIGFDFIDDDGLPFEATIAAGQTKMRPGTTLASIIAREAPKARLAIFKLNPEDGEKIGRTAAMAGQSPVRIVLIPWTGDVAETWVLFEKAAKHFEKLLFVAAAGDEDRDIDKTPNFPANLKLPNLIVVTATEPDGTRTAGANFGSNSVDIAATGSGVMGLAADNTEKLYAGSAIAAARIAAMAARLAETKPELNGAAMKKEILAIAKQSEKSKTIARSGWIKDPDQATP